MPGDDLDERQGGVRIEGGGTALFVSERLAVVARSCVPTDWRERPDVTLIVQEARIRSQVVAENQAREIALLETWAPVAGVAPVSLAGEIGPGLPADAVRDLVAFYASTRENMPGARKVVEPVVYDSAAEAVFLRGLGDLVTPALKAKLRELGLDLDHKLRHQYPRVAWIRMLAVTVAEVFSHLAVEEGYRQLGERSTSGLGVTAIGKTIIGISRLLGPRRSLRRFPEGFSSVNNFMEMTLEELGPTHFRVLFNETYGHPAYIQGAVQAGMLIAGAKELQVLIVEATAHFVSLDVCWANLTGGARRYS